MNYKVYNYKNTPKKTLRQSGFSLIEALIGVGIMSILTLAFGTLLNQQIKATAALEAKLGMMTLQRSVTTILNQGKVCTDAFSGKTLDLTQVGPGLSAPVQLQLDTEILIQDATNLSQGYNILLDQLRLENSTVTDVGLEKFVTGTLAFIASSKDRDRTYRKRNFGTVTLVTNSVGLINRCGYQPLLTGPGQTCPQGSFIRGFNISGELECSSLYDTVSGSGECAANQATVGLNLDGTQVCRSISSADDSDGDACGNSPPACSCDACGGGVQNFSAICTSAGWTCPICRTCNE